MKLFLECMDGIERINEWIARAASILLPALVCVLTIEVIARYVFSRPTLWAYDIAIFMFGYIGLLGGAYVHKLNAHINVDILYGRLSPKGKAIMDAITGCVVLFFLVLAILYAWEPAVDAIRSNEITNTEWGPLMGHYKLLIPIGSFFLFLQALINWMRTLLRLFTNRELP